MNTELITTTSYSVQLTNKDLAKATTAIYNIATGIKKNLFEMAYIIAKVDENKWYVDDGFENVHQWTEKMFGFKKTASYSMLKIGKEYTATIKNPKTGKITSYASNLLPAESPDNFTTAQIDAMLKLGRNKVVELVDSGEISPTMSVRDIKQYIKELEQDKAIDAYEQPLANEPADGAPSEADVEDMEKSFEPEPEKTDLRGVMTIDGTMYQVAQVILEGVTSYEPSPAEVRQYITDILCSVTTGGRWSTAKYTYVRNAIGKIMADCNTGNFIGAKPAEG